ncbi:MAG: hypothetical protein ACRCU2_16195 [Planktothrix sp.]
MTAYILAIGGTGAKLVESMIHAAAVGLFSSESGTEDLQILLIDPDSGNGNAASTQTTLGIYESCSKLFQSNKSRPWMSSKIKRIQGGAWSVFERADTTLKDSFHYSFYNEQDAKKHLFDVLYTQEEQEFTLTEGFRGRPAIGAAIISQLSQQTKNNESWDALINQINDDHQAGKAPKVFLCGSIFGGTGASGLPTLGRLLANKLGEDGKNLLGKIKLGCLLFLPYFQFSPPRTALNETVFARSQDFIINTEAALRYYANQDLKFDTVYLLGLPTLSMVETFSTGGSNQRNPPHFLEFYGALGLRDFLFTGKPNNRQVTLLSREQADAVNWNDIPEFNEVRAKLIASTRFAFAWLSSIVPDLEHAQERPRDVVWYFKFFYSQELKDPIQQDNIKAISDWCKNYLKWLGTIGRSHPGVKWFNWEVFLDSAGSVKTDRAQFTNLVPNMRGKGINQFLPRLNPREIENPNKGAVGLAKALYQIIYRDL